MRKTLLVLGIGLAALSGMLFYAEHNQAVTRTNSVAKAIEDVLRAQNQSLAGRIFEGLSRADRDAASILQRSRKKAQTQSFFVDTALSEPDAPKWSVVAGRRVRAAGVADNALLEDALDAHARASDRLALYAAKGKYFLFIRGEVEGQAYASAYAPEAFFAAFRSADGIRAWLALKDGTVIYHPLPRFIGTNAGNLRPVAAGIQELLAGRAAAFGHRYRGLEGKDALGSWTPLPSFGLLVGSEWPKAPEPSFQATAFFWLAIGTGMFGVMLLGLAWGSAAVPTEAKARLFDENRLDEASMEYLEQARQSATQAIAVAKEQESLAAAALREKSEAVAGVGELRWRLGILEEFQEKVLPQASGKQVWAELAQLMAQNAPGLSLTLYRYSPTSFSLVPEGVHTLVSLPGNARSYLSDSRIFLGNPRLLGQLLETEGFAKWDRSRQRHMPGIEAEFRAYPVQSRGFGSGLLLLSFDRRMNSEGELAASLSLFETLYSRTVTFCDRLSHLLQSSYADGSAWKAVASASNDARNQPRSS